MASRQTGSFRYAKTLGGALLRAGTRRVRKRYSAKISRRTPEIPDRCSVCIRRSSNRSVTTMRDSFRNNWMWPGRDRR